jgi:hypothetical protein
MHVRTTDTATMAGGGLVVAITDNNDKSLREYDFNKINDKARKCKVKIYPDTEYKILVKNNNPYRVAMNVEIDGTTITSGLLIVGAYDSMLLDSFMESNKKLKAVFANNEAVQDPTNKENGIIRVELFKEQDPPKTIVHEEHHHHHHHDDWFRRSSVWPHYPIITCSSLHTNSVGGSIGETQCYCASVKTPEVKTSGGILRGLSPEVSVNEIDTSLATIEGSASDQRFVNDYTWRGVEDNPYVFKFELLAIIKEQYSPEVIKIAKQCGVSPDKAKEIMDASKEMAKAIKPKKSRKR